MRPKKSSSSSVESQLPIYNKLKGKSIFEMTKKSNLQSINEESTGHGKQKRLYRDSMMTPADRNNSGYEYDILT